MADNVYKKLSEARVLLQSKGLRKTGFNKFNKYYYFQLSDFLPDTNKIFKELGLSYEFGIIPKQYNQDGVLIAEEYGNLIIVNADSPDQRIPFVLPTAEAGIGGSTPIQALGGKRTYILRYLWMDAMGIEEDDQVDGLSNDDKDIPQKPTKPAKNKKPELTALDFIGEDIEPF